jgi:hypothetical protein
MKTTLAPFERVRFEVAAEILCAECQCPLDRHQPDPEQPDRLLGTCEDCGTWYLIDGELCVMIALPDARSLRRP